MKAEITSATSSPSPSDLSVPFLCFLALGSNPALTTIEGNILRDARETKQKESAYQQEGEPLTDVELSSCTIT